MGMKQAKTGDTIKDIVRRGQDMLCSLYYGQQRVECSSFYVRYDAFRGATMPQSLGELCIEIAQDRIANKIAYYGEHIYPKSHIDRRRGDIQQLKQAMWHKPQNHQPPKLKVILSRQWIRIPPILTVGDIIRKEIRGETRNTGENQWLP
jgi:hypothetical protein